MDKSVALSIKDGFVNQGYARCVRIGRESADGPILSFCPKFIVRMIVILW